MLINITKGNMNTLNPRNPGYILQRQTLGRGGVDSTPPINNDFQAVLGHSFYIILEIYINKEPMQKIGSPAFIFWSGGPLELSYFEPVYYDFHILGKSGKILDLHNFFLQIALKIKPKLLEI